MYISFMFIILLSVDETMLLILDNLLAVYDVNAFRQAAERHVDSAALQVVDDVRTVFLNHLECQCGSFVCRFVALLCYA